MTRKTPRARDDVRESNEMVSTETVSTETVSTETVSGADAAADVVAQAVDDLTVPAGWGEVEAGGEAEVEQPAMPVADVSLVLPGLFTADAAAALASFYCGRLNMPVQLVRNGLVIDCVFPASAKGRAAAKQANEAVRSFAAESAPKDWGVWHDSELESSPANRGILTLKHRIEAAYEAGDMDALRGFDFRGATVESEKAASTYYKRAGRYLRTLIERLPAELERRERERTEAEARLTAEYGYGTLAA